MVESTFTVYDVRFEHYHPQHTLGVQDSRPRISWKFSGVSEDFQQAAYDIEVYEAPCTSKKILRSARVKSRESRLVPWPCEPLRSRQKVFVRVRAWGTEGSVSLWSEPASIEMGLLLQDDWRGKRIKASEERDSQVPQPEELFRKEFSTRPSITRARLYITAQGVYESEINGQRVGDHFLAPGWTVYDRRIQYQTYDVTRLLSSSGANCIGVRIAEGWFCGRLVPGGGRRNIWGTHPALMAQLEITYDDGTSEMIGTDESWWSTAGPTRLAEIYDGEKYDANFEVLDWSQPFRKPSFDHRWRIAAVMDPLPGTVELVSGWGEPVRRVATIKPIKTIITPSGKTVLDFGQNLVGYIRMKGVVGTKGDKLSLYHAEVLENGELARRPLRNCQALDEYTFRGSADGESWEPRFTFHGYRYCQVDGWPSDSPRLAASFEAVVCHTDMEPTAEFWSSNEMLNQLHSNTVWSMRGNFLSIPTDCPQRDERLGWSGDLALFVPTATKLYNCSGMLKNWLVDVTHDQEARGGVPALVTPNVYQTTPFWGEKWPCAIWHDVTVLAPWALYQEFGDSDLLARQYWSMTTWIERIPRDKARKKILWDPTLFQLGDWLDPSAPPNEPMNGKTDRVLVADAFLVHSLDLVTQIAAILSKDADVEKYKKETETARRQFADEYITANGRMVCDSQTAYALAICFDLFPTSAQKMYAGERLATVVRQNAFKIGTGFAGTPFICEALALTHQAPVAYSMLLNRECPSWLYPVTMGATTIWERWDSMMPDGSINPSDMTSFNHYCFGAVTSFLHERLAGLQRVEPGWKKARAVPTPGGEISSAHAAHLTPYGRIACSWKIQGDQINVTVVVPPTTTMEVVLPFADGSKTKTVGAGEWMFSGPYKRDYEWPV